MFVEASVCSFVGGKIGVTDKAMGEFIGSSFDGFIGAFIGASGSDFVGEFVGGYVWGR